MFCKHSDMKSRTKFFPGATGLGAVLIAVFVGQAWAEAAPPRVLALTVPGLADENGEISFSFAAADDGAERSAHGLVVNLAYEKCMGRTFQGGELEPGETIKGPLEEASWWQAIAECRTDPAVAVWEVTVWRDRILQGVCKLGYMQRANGRRYVSLNGRGSNGSPFCPIEARASCNAAAENCLHDEASGTGPVRVEFSARDTEPATGRASLPLDRATISPFEGPTR